MTKRSLPPQTMAPCEANFAQLTPLSFIARTAAIYPDRTSVIYGQRRFTWSETYTRCRQLAAALRRFGIEAGDTVAVMLPNVPAMYEAHFGVPMIGAMLNTLNTRLDAESIAFMLQHGEAKLVLVDPEFVDVMRAALEKLDGPRPTVINVADANYADANTIGEHEYETVIALETPDFESNMPLDEWDAISLNYTSGTTGNPKGVVYHHRGAYLNAVSNIVSWGMPMHATYLWTLPMFHCNGWCFPWTMALNAGTNICLRRVEIEEIFRLINAHQVSHFCGAPIVHNMLINASSDLRSSIGHALHDLIAGAAPPTAVIEGMEAMGVDLTHVYGLTETYGPAAICAKHDAWEDLSSAERATLNGRQGVAYHLQEAVDVFDPQTMQAIPADGKTVGEVMFRGNIVMQGYLKNPSATADAFDGGWFHTGDLAVKEADGYVKIKDRSKDVIISGGENISSLEVEESLYRHSAVLLAAVVAQADPKWGEVPCAFVELKAGCTTSEAEIIEHCRGTLAKFKIPKKVIFGELPKTSTGKIQKFALRERLRNG